MQNLKINKGKLQDKVFVPSSKSYANRALIISAVLKNSPTLSRLPDATDVTILLRCLREIGLKFDYKNHSVKFQNSFPACETVDVTIDVGEGGTTARFIAAMLLLGKRQYKLVLGERLKERPWQEFIDLVRSHGGKASLEDEVLTLQGPLKFPKELAIDCTKTTQFASAFQLIYPATHTKVVPVNMSSSQSYWAMTEKMVEELKTVSSYSIPLDWSSASYPLAFAALNQTIRFPGLHPDIYQADSKFFDLLAKFNCIKEDQEGCTVSPVTSKQNVNMDVSDCLDLVPTLAYFLSHVEGEHKLSGIGNLVHKESDRLNEVIKLLGLFNRKSHTSGDELMISGKGTRENGMRDLVMPNDHRMVMVGTLFLLHHNGGTITPPEAVAKSYPEFFGIISS